MAPPLWSIDHNIRHRPHKADLAQHLTTTGEELDDNLQITIYLYTAYGTTPSRHCS